MDKLINSPAEDEKFSPWRRIKAWSSSLSTLSFVMIPVLLAFLVGLGSPWVLKQVYADDAPKLFQSICTVITFFLLGSIGVPIILRKELPPMTFFSVKGVPAIIIGFIFIVLWWGLALLGIRQVYWLLIGS